MIRHYAALNGSVLMCLKTLEEPTLRPPDLRQHSACYFRHRPFDSHPEPSYKFSSDLFPQTDEDH